MTFEERLDYFLNKVARGTVQEFLDALEPSPEPEASSEPGARLLRLGVLAAIVVNQLVEFIHKERPDLLKAWNEGKDAFFERLAKECCPELPLLRDVADATKHPRLFRQDQIPGIEAVRLGNPQICGRDKAPITSRDDEPLRGRPLTVLVDTQSGEKPLADIVRECWTKLEEMVATPRPVP